MTDDKIKASGKSVLELESKAIERLIDRIDKDFVLACRLILKCDGRVVVVGMGKSGHIGGKIAATLASTGTPSFFVHPGEASHGDLGMITDRDIVLALSNSGETPEILTILPMIKRMGIKLIALTGRGDSTLGREADAILDSAVEKEACPLNLAPTSSTTTALAMGDALAVALLESRGFTQDDFARSHPGGALGRRLLLYVKDLMHTGAQVPVVKSGAPLGEALLEMSSKGLGVTGIANEDGQLLGIFTDGDLRRALNEGADVYHCKIDEVMTTNPITTREDILAAELVELMGKRSINSLFVVDGHNQVTGALNMHDLLKAGVV